MTTYSCFLSEKGSFFSVASLLFPTPVIRLSPAVFFSIFFFFSFLECFTKNTFYFFFIFFPLFFSFSYFSCCTPANPGQFFCFLKPFDGFFQIFLGGFYSASWSLFLSLLSYNGDIVAARLYAFFLLVWLSTLMAHCSVKGLFFLLGRWFLGPVVRMIMRTLWGWTVVSGKFLAEWKYGLVRCD